MPVSFTGCDVVLLLIDYAHVALTPHPDVLRHGSEPELASLDGSMAGRAFTSGTALAAERDDGWHIWVPVTEQSNRLGVLAMTLTRWDEEIEFLCTELGLAAASLLLASAQYTDLPHMLRRRKDMDLAAEMQWSLRRGRRPCAHGFAHRRSRANISWSNRFRDSDTRSSRLVSSRLGRREADLADLRSRAAGRGAGRNAGRRSQGEAGRAVGDGRPGPGRRRHRRAEPPTG